MSETMAPEFDRPLAKPVKTLGRLRLWPLGVLLLILIAAKLPEQFVEMGMAMFFVGALAPLVIALAMVIWWCFASRSPRAERWLGLLALLAIVGISYAILHPSMRGFGFVMGAFPIGVGATAAAFLIFARLGTRIRLPATLLVAAIAFGSGALIRSEGIAGDFRADLRWRWEPTAEDQFLASLEKPSPGSRGQPETEQTTESIGDVLWGEFRGPHRDGVVPDAVLKSDWKQEPPKELWRRKIGPGWSSFTLAGNRLFTQEQRGESECVVCYSADTGEERWINSWPARFWEAIAGAGPRGTPTISDGKVFALGATGRLQCLDPLTGTVIWTRELKTEAKREPPTWGFASSPLVLGDVVIVHAGGQGNKGMLAFDRATGEPRWSVPSGDHSYSSPQLAAVNGQNVVLMLTNTGLEATDADQGKQLWNYEWGAGGYRVVQPLVLDGSDVVLGTGMGTGTRRVGIGVHDNVVQFVERWTSLDMKPDYNDYVVHKGYLYGFDHNIFGCVDLETGKRKWKKGRYGNGQVLLLPKEDQLLVLSEMGELVLLRANPEKLEELTRWKALEGKTWNHPILVGNRLFARNGEEAACFELPLK